MPALVVHPMAGLSASNDWLEPLSLLLRLCRQSERAHDKRSGEEDTRLRRWSLQIDSQQGPDVNLGEKALLPSVVESKRIERENTEGEPERMSASADLIASARLKSKNYICAYHVIVCGYCQLSWCKWIHLWGLSHAIIKDFFCSIFPPLESVFYKDQGIITYFDHTTLSLSVRSPNIWDKLAVMSGLHR